MLNAGGELRYYNAVGYNAVDRVNFIHSDDHSGPVLIESLKQVPSPMVRYGTCLSGASWVVTVQPTLATVMMRRTWGRCQTLRSPDTVIRRYDP
ncbi:hypothetical protein [Arthrobacter sp. A5]|uniref:hypothetical protein n=1 Tax=Arthrobacter sp. A5 TaxID=576926 RepID=UPI003DA871A4